MKCVSTGLKPGVNETTFEAKPVFTRLSPEPLDVFSNSAGDSLLGVHALGVSFVLVYCLKNDLDDLLKRLRSEQRISIDRSDIGLHFVDMNVHDFF